MKTSGAIHELFLLVNTFIEFAGNFFWKFWKCANQCRKEIKIKTVHALPAYTVKKLREIPMWTTVGRTKRREGRKIPTPTSFGSAPPLSASEFGAFRHSFFTVYKRVVQVPSIVCRSYNLLIHYRDECQMLVRKVNQPVGSQKIWLYTVKKPCRNAPNSDVDNGGAEPNDVGVGIFRHPCRLVHATVVHIEISRSFFYSVGKTSHILSPLAFSINRAENYNSDLKSKEKQKN